MPPLKEGEKTHRIGGQLVKKKCMKREKNPADVSTLNVTAGAQRGGKSNSLSKGRGRRKKNRIGEGKYIR